MSIKFQFILHNAHSRESVVLFLALIQFSSALFHLMLDGFTFEIELGNGNVSCMKSAIFVPNLIFLPNVWETQPLLCLLSWLLAVPSMLHASPRPPSPYQSQTLLSTLVFR